MTSTGPSPELAPDDSPGHPLARWFPQWRADRAAARAATPTAPGDARPSRAVVTIVHDEPVFLPVWLHYYSRFFAAQDIYVLDNESDPATMPAGGYVRIPATRGTVDHKWMVRTVEALQHELLEHYNIVLVTDVDEVVAPHPRLGHLGAYLDVFREEWVNCLGYELLHMPDREPGLRLDKPILNQRGYWFYNDGYSKAALATAPMSWRPGFHGRSDFQMRPDPDLRLIHLHRVDYDLCLARHRTRSRRPWAEPDARDGWAIHNRITEEEAFRRWFHEDSCFSHIEIRPERIPPAWRGVF